MQQWSERSERNNLTMKQQSQGFSLIELLLVITIIALLGTAILPVGSSFLIRNHLKNKTNEVVSSLRLAQINTLAGKENSQWGLYISANKIIMFKGSSYAVPGTSFDQSYDIPASITITQTEIVFDKLTGNPNTTANIAISSNLDSHTVSVNEVGVVDVQ